MSADLAEQLHDLAEQVGTRLASTPDWRLGVRCDACGWLAQRPISTPGHRGPVSATDCPECLIRHGRQRRLSAVLVAVSEVAT